MFANDVVQGLFLQLSLIWQVLFMFELDDDDDDEDTQANIRTYGKFCSLFEEEVAKVDQELGDITEVIIPYQNGCFRKSS